MKISLSEIRYVQVYLNMFRVLPYYYIVNHCRFKEKVKEDIDAWIRQAIDECDRNKHIRIVLFGYCLCKEKAFRNVMLNRLHRNPIKYIFGRLLFKPLDTLYINMSPENINGGLYFQHGFSTIIAAKEIGKNCSINQQVTVGYNGDKNPIIGNNVKIGAGAIVIGKAILNDNVTVGANSIVTKEIPQDSIVVGENRIIK